jgi:hypothetical protein
MGPITRTEFPGQNVTTWAEKATRAYLERRGYDKDAPYFVQGGLYTLIELRALRDVLDEAIGESMRVVQ